jgi:hypothetical protein
MAIYIGNNQVIDDYNELIVGPYATRASLPAAGVVGYMAYVTDQNELVINTGQTVHPNTGNSPAAPSTTSNSPDSGVTWYKVLTNPVSSQLSAVLNQGTLAGGYTGGAIWNEITNIKFATDSSTLMQQTLPWATKYSSANSTNGYAYYHTGWLDQANTIAPAETAKQSWTTAAIALISSTRPTVGGGQAVTFQSGSAIDATSQNIGVIQYGYSADYINFTTDTWSTDARYIPPVAEGYGFSASGSLFSYVTRANVQKFNWANSSWTGTGQASPTAGSTRGGMSTGWNKCYNGCYEFMDKYDQSVDLWTALSSGQPAMLEISTITGQNWGYWFGIPYYSNGSTTGYGPASRKTLYATDTTFDNPQTAVGVGGWGSAVTPGAVDGSPTSGNSACTATGP